MRVVTLNFWGIEAPLDRRLALAERQLAALAPDVIGLQEVRPLDGKAGRTTADELGTRLGMDAVHAVALRWEKDQIRPGMDEGQEGLAILSRHPILEHRVLQLPEARPDEARALLSALIATPHGRIWVHTTHLHYKLDDGVARERQVAAIDAAVRALGRGLTDAPQILCGDFNATPDSDEIRFLRGLATLEDRRTHWQDAWLRMHPSEEGVTWSSENQYARRWRSLDLDRRIDYVFVTTRKKDLRGTIERCELVLTEREGQGPDEICASDHYGVMADVVVG